MDEGNHEMVNMLTQQRILILRTVIKNSVQSYQTLATQMTRMGDFLGAPRVKVR